MGLIALLGLQGCPTDDHFVLTGQWSYGDYNFRGHSAAVLDGAAEFRTDGTFTSTGSAGFPSEAGPPSLPLSGSGTWAISGSALTLTPTLLGIASWDVVFSDHGNVASLTAVGAAFPQTWVLTRQYRYPLSPKGLAIQDMTLAPRSRGP
jgi:hypothetical protein